MEKTIIKNSSAGLSIKITKDQLELIRRTVAKGATNDELKMFFHISKKTNLDPFLKEIFFIKYKDGSNVITTSRDGFLSLAQRTGEFRGLQSESVHEKDEFEMEYTKDGGVEVKHKIVNAERGTIIGAWARAFREKCSPAGVWVEFSTYKKNSPTWAGYPDAMIKKCAESIVLKKLFGIAGLTSMEEIGYEYEMEEPKTAPKEIQEQPVVENQLKLKQ